MATLALLRRDGDRCHWCGRALAGRAERHHRQRRRDGGDRLSNLVLLHPEHHAEVHAHPALARERGFIVSMAADPADVPLLMGGVWYALDDDGGRVVAAPVEP